jgi:Uma2 family endonuclease
MAQTILPKASPAGEVWVLDGVSWTQYTRFLRAFEDRPGFRLTYDRGTLEIMSPTLRHDRPGRFLAQLVWVLTDILHLPIIPDGSTTLRRKLKRKGAEPDDCFWIANAHRMRDKLDLNLRRDPPPDLAIEVGVSSSSLNRMAIYAALGVPELWRLEGDLLQFFILQANGNYKETGRSKAFPQVTSDDLVRFLARARRESDLNRVLRDFRKWIRSRKRAKPKPEGVRALPPGLAVEPRFPHGTQLALYGPRSGPRHAAGTGSRT